MENIELVIIYVMGIPLGYLAFRYVFSRQIAPLPYTISDRYFGLVVSLFSWITVFVAGLQYLTLRTEKDNKPSKW